MKIGLIDCGSRYIRKLEDGLAGVGAKVIVVDTKMVEKADFDGVDGAVISGSPTNLSEIDGESIMNKFSFLNMLENPILGVCFGHQLLAVANGANVWKGSDVNEDVEIEVMKSNKLFGEVGDELVVAERHEEYVGVPKNFELLARSEDCEVEAMRHRSKQVYGVQFHPEISGEVGRVVLKNFVSLCEG